ncbi:FAD-binding oxidoreductase [Aliiroseovarius sp. PTFE2010]|uniref:FAD-binding oxidoreductase n=1 Tax=Aliiroseovarius sp. PTFE2010 TaxID=3417190 RepID=UPI003CF89040
MTLSPADASFCDQLHSLLPAGTLRAVEPRDLEEPRGRVTGHAGAVAIPATTDEVATIVRACAHARVGIVPIGGGTGLVQGQIMADGPAPLLMSLERMGAIRAIYPQENVLVAEAGAILADIQSAAEGAGRIFPLSLASEGSCRIGGNLSTNAGGLNVLRYGNARDLCLGLEAVLPDGSIWNGLKRLRKDNTGYDLRNLLIGAEGTLGIITAASLRLFAKPACLGTALFVVPSPQAALDLFALANDLAGGAISAFELISGQGLRFLDETVPDLRLPYDTPPDWMVLIELGLPDGQDPADVFEALFLAALSRGMTTDGIIAQSDTQARDLWAVRETIPVANRRIGAIASHDISLPLSAIPHFIDQANGALQRYGDIRINCFGHLGDGNLHFNAFPAKGRDRADYAAIRDDITRTVHDLVQDFDGSFSAEHGVGRLKVDDLERYGDPGKLGAMRAIKAALDPAGIMNPGAVLRLR